MDQVPPNMHVNRMGLTPKGVSPPCCPRPWAMAPSWQKRTAAPTTFAHKLERLLGSLLVHRGLERHIPLTHPTPHAGSALTIDCRLWQRQRCDRCLTTECQSRMDARMRTPSPPLPAQPLLLDRTGAWISFISSSPPSTQTCKSYHTNLSRAPCRNHAPPPKNW